MDKKIEIGMMIFTIIYNTQFEKNMIFAKKN